jgi:hypothetical protein
MFLCQQYKDSRYNVVFLYCDKFFNSLEEHVTCSGHRPREAHEGAHLERWASLNVLNERPADEEGQRPGIVHSV